MWLFTPPVLFQWFGFWQVVGLMYVLIGILLLVGIRLNRPSKPYHGTMPYDSW